MFRIITLVLLTLVASAAKAEDEQGPAFEKGMWHFVHTMSKDMDKKFFSNARFGIHRERTSCVNPTDNMRKIFSQEKIGTCIPELPQKEGNRYFFARRCDFRGPSRTEIVVTSPTSYEETNEVIASKNGLKDTVVATRLGDCK